jgi:hypothetical protein
MQPGSTQGIDFGYNDGGLTALDQYGRTFNMTGTPGTYEAKVVSSAPNVVSVDQASFGGQGTTLTAQPTSVGGTATITFQLINTTNPGVIIDSKSETISVLAGTNISGYTLGTVPNAIYAGSPANTTGSSITGSLVDYTANPEVYGTTSSGSKIVLAPGTGSGNTILGASVSDPTDFVVLPIDGKPADVKVAALAPANSVATASTTLTVTVMGTDGLVHTVITPITSSTAAPVAASVGISVATQDAGISLDTTGNNVTIDSTLGANLAPFAAGNYLTKYIPGGAATAQIIYFAPLDQYGETSTALSQIIQTAATVNGVASTTQFIGTDGKILTSLTPGTTVTLTGVATNGALKTINIIVK